MHQTKTHPLKIARERRNLSQEALAGFIGLGVATIQRAERGNRLRLDVRQRLCDYFSMTPLELGLLSEVENKPDGDHTDETPESGSDNVNRRDFIQSVGAAGVALLAPTQTMLNSEAWERFSKALKRPSTIDETTLSHLEKLGSSFQILPAWFLVSYAAIL
jgi:transcriptional regulator with XRE-family HTH domain